MVASSPFAGPSRLASLAQIGELARRLLRKLRYTLVWQAALRRFKTGIFEQLCRKKRLNHCMI